MSDYIKITCAEKDALLAQEFRFEFPVQYTEYNRLSQQDLYEKVCDQDVIIISDLTIDEKVLKNNPNLKLIALCSTGFDHIDLEQLKSRNIKICNIRGYAGDAVAEHAFLLMMNLIKNFSTQLNAVNKGSWSKGQASFYLAAPMYELKGKTLVILGKGEIGLALAKKADAFGMKVIFSERKNATSCRQGYIDFDDAIQQADILSLHCEFNKQTIEIINYDVLKRIKKGCILINVGRGGLLNNQDVVNALEQKLLGGLGIDVLDIEPPPKNHPLLQLEHLNVMVTAHIAWATNEAQQRLFNILEDNINSNILGSEKNLL
ncbi:hypothetical protein P256_02505 [Acinetobacter nectaris CIP 110549]|uniref:D-isomer specific 2-hydroxyacid dehydrogenase NAD-binding domain-containing protein n=1 Tax=Acinetobacter nectaris CIP 110549 TaxID=1392540 RepID=V2T2B8_9GAMM|nr:NAD(P)-dependent oxidoreductase [Acinetobacter nectaris]ESK36593.1 hypothetical protein P256_02505 [Acinetobacter nectaris CIP 110549]